MNIYWFFALLSLFLWCNSVHIKYMTTTKKKYKTCYEVSVFSSLLKAGRWPILFFFYLVFCFWLRVVTLMILGHLLRFYIYSTDLAKGPKHVSLKKHVASLNLYLWRCPSWHIYILWYFYVVMMGLANFSLSLHYISHKLIIPVTVILTVVER